MGSCMPGFREEGVLHCECSVCVLVGSRACDDEGRHGAMAAAELRRRCHSCDWRNRREQACGSSLDLQDHLHSQTFLWLLF